MLNQTPPLLESGTDVRESKTGPQAQFEREGQDYWPSLRAP